MRHCLVSTLAGALLATVPVVAQTCYTMPVVTPHYRTSWGSDFLPLPGVSNPRGAHFDDANSRLLVLTSTELLTIPVQRGTGGGIVAVGTPQVLAPSPLPGAARSLVAVGSRVYTVGRPNNVNSLYELDLNGTGSWVPHQLLPMNVANVRIEAVAIDSQGIAGSGNPDDLIIYDWNGRVWQLQAIRAGNNPLSVTNITRQFHPLIGELWQPIYVPPGEPGFSSQRRSVVAVSRPSAGLSSEYTVFECGLPGPQPSFGDWVPAQVSAAATFQTDGECRGATRDPVTGDLLFVLRRTWDGYSLQNGTALSIVRRGQTSIGCAESSTGGSGTPPYPVVSHGPSVLQPGGSFGLNTTGAPANAIGALRLSLEFRENPINNLTVLDLNGAVSVLIFADGSGGWTSPTYALPADPSWVGKRIFSQTGFVDAATSAVTVSGIARLLIR